MSRTGLYWAIVLSGFAVGHPSRVLAQEAWIAQVSPAQFQRSLRSGPSAASGDAVLHVGRDEPALRAALHDGILAPPMDPAAALATMSGIGSGHGLVGVVPGGYNQVGIVQTGDRNGISLVQDGNRNAAALVQSGLGNQLTVMQSGEGLVMSSYQSGTGNVINLRQSGILNVVQTTQIGQSNQLGAIQTGAGNRLIAVQR